MQSDTASIEAAVDAGVSAYIVGGLQQERSQNILDLCISRFNAFARLRDELERTRTALDERKVIDRAKGILMKAKTLSEHAAYALLRKTAMNEKKKIAEVAQSVVTGARAVEVNADGRIRAPVFALHKIFAGRRRRERSAGLRARRQLVPDALSC